MLRRSDYILNMQATQHLNMAIMLNNRDKNIFRELSFKTKLELGDTGSRRLFLDIIQN